MHASALALIENTATTAATGGGGFSLPSFQQLALNAGPMALAAFAGVLLGGIALSFFWKNFGPWQLLEACRAECANCTRERQADQLERERLRAEFADQKARYETLLEAVNRSGLGLRLTPPIRPD